MATWPYNTSLWQRLRRTKLAATPLCEACAMRGKRKLANAVDHKKPINQGGEPFPALDELMSLCTSCHNEKTARHDQHGTVNGRRFKGFDVHGNPVDTADAWHGGASNHGDHVAAGPHIPKRVDILPEKNSKKDLG